MPFVVLRWPLAKGDHAVEITTIPRLAGWHAYQQGRVRGARAGLQLFDHLRNFGGKGRHGRFRPDHQWCLPRAGTQLQIVGQRTLAQFAVPFLILRDRTLDQRDIDVTFEFAGPVLQPQRSAGAADSDQQESQQRPLAPAGHQALRQEASEEHDHAATTTDTEERCEAGERRIDLAVTEREPREAGEQPTPQPFGQHP